MTDTPTVKAPEAIEARSLEVRVDDRGLERAVKKLRKLIANEGVLREMKRRRFYEKPSERRKRKEREAARRRKRRMKRAMMESE